MGLNGDVMSAEPYSRCVNWQPSFGDHNWLESAAPDAPGMAPATDDQSVKPTPLIEYWFPGWIIIKALPLHYIFRFSTWSGYHAVDLWHRRICRRPAGDQNDGLSFCRSIPTRTLYVYFHRMGNFGGMDCLAWLSGTVRTDWNGCCYRVQPFYDLVGN